MHTCGCVYESLCISLTLKCDSHESSPYCLTFTKVTDGKAVII